jgi:hypothetical protein
MLVSFQELARENKKLKLDLLKANVRALQSEMMVKQAEKTLFEFGAFSILCVAKLTDALRPERA